MTWLEYVVKAFENLGGVVNYEQLYKEILLIRKEEFRKNWKSSVRATIERNSSDSKAFEGKNDIFYSVDGLGKGIWGLRNYKKEVIKEEEEVYRTSQSIDRIIRNTKIVKELKVLHNNTCQICGCKIKIDNNRYYSEGHHIKPLGKPHSGPDKKENIIILCPNCHVKFDNGVININNIKIEENKYHKIDNKYIEYYNSHIFKKIEE